MSLRAGRILAALALLATPAAFGQPIAAETPALEGPVIDRGGLASLKRLIRRFDFEEAELAPVEFPVEFRRHIAEDLGFPKFGRTGLADDHAWAGRWSLKFDLDGGSLAAEVPPGVLPVLPMADYVVTTMVRTAGLRHARVRLVATFHDALGEPIVESRAETTGIRTGGQWERLSVRLPGDFPAATHLRIELELLQPRHLGSALDPTRPVIEDVRGAAWFDDLSVWHLPRLELAMSGDSNVILLPDAPSVDVLVHDLANEPLSATLRVEDFNGAIVHDETFPAPRGRRPVSMALPVKRAGWYRIVLDVVGGGMIAGEREITFLLLPRSEPSPVRTAESLAVTLPHVAPDRLEQLAEVIRHLHVRGVVVRIWDRGMSPDLASDRFFATRTLVEDLLRTDSDLTFALDTIPATVASDNGLDPEHVLEFLNQDASRWRPWLDEMLLNFGLRVRRWQLGSTAFPDAFWKPDLPALVQGATDALGRFIPNPTTIIPFSAEQEIDASLALPGVHVTIPHEFRPETIGAYADPWAAGGRDVFVSFDQLPTDVYAPRQQIIDLALRGLYGWRAGLRQMAIDAPWHWEDDRMAPEPAFAAWRGLADALRGRTFAGELPLAEGVQCWLMESRTPGDDALILWSDQQASTETIETRLMLAEHDVELVDLFGNRAPVEVIDGTHRIPLSDLPVLVENIDLPLARFRAGFRIVPDQMESQRRVHEAAIVLENPWDVGISGRLRLDPPGDCEVSPRAMDFLIRPRESIELPVTMVFDRSVIAGAKRFEAEVSVAAGRDYRLRMHTTMNVGWSEVEHSATWSLAENVVTGAPEIVVSQAVTNRGERTLTLDTFLLGRGVGQSRRPIASLQPGATAIKTFRIPGSARDWAGHTFRVGVTERDGIAELNRLLRIPEFLAEGAPSTAGADTQ